MNIHVSVLSEPIHNPNKHTRALRSNGSPTSACGITITGQEQVRRGSIVFESRLTPGSCESGRGLLPVTNCHASPFLEPIHDPNKHKMALRSNGNTASWCGVPITGQEQVLRGSIFRISPHPWELRERQGTPSRDKLSCITVPS